ncbi:hypothetical protein LINPERPRIM_LOCUS24797 [Linum perenne]
MGMMNQNSRVIKVVFLELLEFHSVVEILFNMLCWKMPLRISV